ncbi:hypothetical protein BOTBODRAFT_180128 [Botryobasidium botryosum FD-172 SS1]|uniref:F-box domain-containing protein n=1 Tax=Botryobasidium botryosum (strain FD-172 SS1) TaxID=930990 RepID=A0A067LXY9_BOTB1|nr:hypothetical protein BOTBODRAFT_180128 [Botryobasidium botryosum FD-172 SS1]
MGSLEDLDVQITTSDIVPPLIQMLCKRIRQAHQDEPSELLGAKPTRDSMDAQCAVIELAQRLAINAINSYAGEILSAVRRRRNQLTAIHRLPNEILALIFEFTECSPENAKQPLDLRSPINISQVSKLWREIALDTATLWTAIDAVNAPILHIFTSRSKRALLDIKLLPGREFHDEEGHVTVAHHYQTTHFPGFIRKLLPHINRWKSMQLLSLTRSTLERCLNEPAHQLDTFHAHCSAHDIESPVYTYRFFDDHTPRLRDLSLVGVCVSLQSPMFTGLTCLHLERVQYTHSSVYQLLQNLAACPLLEDLHLWHVRFPLLTTNPDLLSESQLLVGLPRLQGLTLRGLQDHLTQFILASIRVSPFLGLGIGLFDPTDFESILPPNADLVDNLLNLHHICTLVVQSSHRGDGCIFIAQSSETDLFTIYFDSTGAADRGVTERTVSAIGQVLPFPNLTSLSFEGLLFQNTLGMSTFTRVLQDLPTITTLALHECLAKFAEELVVTPALHLCPLLQTLELTASKITAERLVAIVKSRTETGGQTLGDGARLGEIILSDCAAAIPGTMRELESFGVKVTVVAKS